MLCGLHFMYTFGMSFMSREERAFAKAVSRINYSNPFLPERLEAEREALGDAYADPGPVWSLGSVGDERANIDRLRTKIEALVSKLREALARGAPASEEDRGLYEDLV